MGGGASKPKAPPANMPSKQRQSRGNSLLTPGDAKAIATAAAGNAKATSPINTGFVGEVDLISTLHDGDATGVFMAYARQDLSEENLEFFLAVASFRLAYDAAADEAAQKALADEIVATYLKAGAPKQVCIGDNKVKLLLEEIAGGGGIHREMWFNPASIALRTLAEDIFPRFQVSDAGKELAAARPALCETPEGAADKLKDCAAMLDAVAEWRKG